MHNIEDACRQTSLDKQFGDAQRHADIALGWFQDERVTCRDGGRAFPERDHRREVEGRNASNNAKRLTHRIHIDARACTIGEFTLQHLWGADAEFDHFQPTLNIALGIGNRLAVFFREQSGEAVIFGVDEFEEAHHHAGAALRIGGCPCWLRFFGVFNGGANFGL